jgi:hypothetical protein
MRSPTIGPLILTFFLATFAFGAMESTLSLVNRILITGKEVERDDMLRSKEALKESDVERKNFLIFAYVGVVLMLVQGGIYRRMVKRVGEVRFMRLGIVLMVLGLSGGVVVLLTRSEFSSSTMLILSALAVFTIAVMASPSSRRRSNR